MSALTVSQFALPARTNVFAAGARGSKYDLAALRAETTDCIILEGEDAKKEHSKLSSAVSNFRKANKTGEHANARFTIRTFKGEDGVTRVGVWRIADAVPAAAPAAEGEAA
jgi:hypothetical protein